jgi:fatty-acyl-CoA synthase
MGDGETLCDLLDSEDVTLALGVPTVWLALLQYCEKAGKRLDKLQRTIVGGAALPRTMIQAFRDQHDVEARQAWGMTETSPLGVANSLKAGLPQMTAEEKLDLATKAGRGVFGCELRIVDDEGNELPWDGEAFGPLQVRGPWICSDYYKLDGSGGAHTEDGWFDTGDVATIDPEGYMAITDRTKDVIKSGGEWISSIELENTIMAHPAVAEAAVVRCSSSSRPKVKTPAKRICSPITKARLRHGGFRATSNSSMRCHTPRPARSRRLNCASNSPTISPPSSERESSWATPFVFTA